MIKVTRNLEEVKPGDNVLFIEDGEIVCEGSHERINEMNKRYKDISTVAI